MGLLTELNKAINDGFDKFKTLVDINIAVKADFLEDFFWAAKPGVQLTVLNYLVYLYPEPSQDNKETPLALKIKTCIDYVIQVSKDNDIDAPLHQAIALRKYQLALHLLNNEIKEGTKTRSLFDLNKRDKEGRTILSLTLSSRNINLLQHVLRLKPNVHAPTMMKAKDIDPRLDSAEADFRYEYQPLHQAIALNSAESVRLLMSQGTIVGNYFGPGKDSGFTLACRLGNIESLEALLDAPAQCLTLEDENNHTTSDGIVNHTAIEELCVRISKGINTSEAIKGVAMLLCRGAEPPRPKEMRHLLGTHRHELLKTIDAYLEDRPSLVDNFVARCHLRETPLHDIIYANHSWGNAVRYLFGKPSDVAFSVENLMYKKYSKTTTTPNPIPTAAAEKFSANDDPKKLYAIFAKRYHDAYESQTFTNSWSTMRWMIAEGKCDWDTVVRYSKNHPTSRTRLIVNQMLKAEETMVNEAEEAIELSMSPK